MNTSQSISLVQLAALEKLEEAVVESLDPMLYRLLVKTAGHWYYVATDRGALIARNQSDLLRLLVGKAIGGLWLKHASAYDEMIGLDSASGTNTLLVPLGMPEESMR